MSQSEARAWWADVEHVRETIEARRRAAALRAAGGAREPGDEPASPGAVAAHDELAARRRARAGARRDHDDWLVPDDLLAPGERRVPRGDLPEADDLPAPAGAAFEPAGAATQPVPADRREALAALTPRPDAPRPRRTVQITGRTVPAPPARPLDASDRAGRAHRPHRAFRTPQALAGPQPDRIAMWAVILGFVLLVAAATSADAHALAAALSPPR